MVNVTNKPFMLSDIMLNVIMLSVDMVRVMAPFFVREWKEILFLLRHKNCRQFWANSNILVLRLAKKFWPTLWKNKLVRLKEVLLMEQHALKM